MPSEQFFSYIKVRTSYTSIRWWCLLCSRSTRWIAKTCHSRPLGHNISIPSQPVFARTP